MTTVRNNADYIPEMVRRIVEAVHPLQVILFGSHARGDARPDSDVDLLVVMPDGSDLRRAWDEAYGSLSGMGIPKDIVITSPTEIARRGHIAGLILRPALREGKILHGG